MMNYRDLVFIQSSTIDYSSLFRRIRIAGSTFVSKAWRSFLTKIDEAVKADQAPPTVIDEIRQQRYFHRTDLL